MARARRPPAVREADRAAHVREVLRDLREQLLHEERIIVLVVADGLLRGRRCRRQRRQRQRREQRSSRAHDYRRGEHDQGDGPQVARGAAWRGLRRRGWRDMLPTRRPSFEHVQGAGRSRERVTFTKWSRPPLLLSSTAPTVKHRRGPRDALLGALCVGGVLCYAALVRSARSARPAKQPRRRPRARGRLRRRHARRRRRGRDDGLQAHAADRHARGRHRFVAATSPTTNRTTRRSASARPSRRCPTSRCTSSSPTSRSLGRAT